MYDKNLEQFINSCMMQNQANKIKEYQTYVSANQAPWASKPYNVPNMIKIQSLECYRVPESTGSIVVNVSTALGALPVADAGVTIYKIKKSNEESIFTYLKTGINGQTATVQVPVICDENNPNASSEYFYSTYNIKIEADGYDTENIFDAQVFPNMKSIVRTSLTPSVKDSLPGKDNENIFIPSHELDGTIDGGAVQ